MRIAFLLGAAAGLFWSSSALAVNVGYYELCAGGGVASQVAPINTAGHTPVLLSNVDAASLAGIQVLFAQNCSNGDYGAEYVANLSNIEAFVSGGGVLILHDRFVDDAESILPGGGSFDIVRDFSDGANIDVVNDTTIITNGPGGVIDDSSLDGGSSSSHGFTFSSSLPIAALRILSTGDPDHIVTFVYSFGAGAVIYSSIPLDHYLAGSGSAGVNTNMGAYAANVVAFAATLNVRLFGLAYSGADGVATLYEIDIATGAPTAIGSTGFQRCGGLAITALGLALATCERNNGSNVPVLVSIDLTTGAGTEIGPTGLSGSIGDISFRSDGVLFAYDASNSPTHMLATINTGTGAGAIVGDTGLGFNGGNGMAFDLGDVLVHANTSNIHTLNQATGAATVLRSAAFSSGTERFSAFAFHPISGELYGAFNTSFGPSMVQLATLDLTTGEETEIGPVVVGLDAIAFTSGFVAAVVIDDFEVWQFVLDHQYNVFANRGGTSSMPLSTLAGLLIALLLQRRIRPVRPE